MAWNSGTFTRGLSDTGWRDDDLAGRGIESERHDNNDNDLATGINNCINKAGQNAPTADLPMGGYKHSGVGDATGSTNYAKVSQLYSNSFESGASGGTANALTLTMTPAIAAYTTKQKFTFFGAQRNTSSVTLDVDGKGAKTLKKYIGDVKYNLTNGDLTLNSPHTAVYDGTDLVVLNPQFPNTINHSVESASVNNSAAETTVATQTIYAGTIGYNVSLKLTMLIACMNFSGSNKTLTVRTKANGTTLDSQVFTYPTSGNLYTETIDLYFFGQNGTCNGNVSTSLGVNPRINNFDLSVTLQNSAGVAFLTSYLSIFDLRAI